MTITQTTRQRFESLTGLRFLLAIWIAYFHVGHMYDHDGFGTIPYLELGVARVDVFFVLSGFVLAHVYWAQRTRPFAFGDFMMARLARIYPLHVFALGVIIAYLLLGMSIGKADHITNYSITGLLGNLALLQSFGLPDVVYWNFPAWAISAEFAGYLAFPLYILIADKMRGHAFLFLALCLLNVFLIDNVHRLFLDRPLSQSTMDWGALRGAVVMLVGVGARAAFDQFSVSSFRAGIYAIAGAACALIAAISHLGTAFVALGGAIMIMSLARIDAHAKPTFLSTKTLCKLGGWSYAIFILHVPIFIILKNGLDVLGIPFVVNGWTSLAFTLVVVAISYPAHHLIEEPSRKLIRDSWNGRKKRSKQASAVQTPAE